MGTEAIVLNIFEFQKLSTLCLEELPNDLADFDNVIVTYAEIFPPKQVYSTTAPQDCILYVARSLNMQACHRCSHMSFPSVIIIMVIDRGKMKHG